jgi:plastocyanin domain-containing protein
MLKIKKNTLNNILILIAAIFIIGFIIILISNLSTSNNTAASTATFDSTGKQIIEMTAKGGFTPNLITASADTESLLKVVTKGTFDCSSTLTIPSLGIYNVQLPFTGTKEIAIPPQKPGTELNGTCSMGMYSFKIKFT